MPQLRNYQCGNVYGLAGALFVVDWMGAMALEFTPGRATAGWAALAGCIIVIAVASGGVCGGMPLAFTIAQCHSWSERGQNSGACGRRWSTTEPLIPSCAEAALCRVASGTIPALAATHCPPPMEQFRPGRGIRPGRRARVALRWLDRSRPLAVPRTFRCEWKAAADRRRWLPGRQAWPVPCAAVRSEPGDRRAVKRSWL